jgi:hypothetical protein
VTVNQVAGYGYVAPVACERTQRPGQEPARGALADPVTTDPAGGGGAPGQSVTNADGPDRKVRAVSFRAAPRTAGRGGTLRPPPSGAAAPGGTKRPSGDGGTPADRDGVPARPLGFPSAHARAGQLGLRPAPADPKRRGRRSGTRNRRAGHAGLRHRRGAPPTLRRAVPGSSPRGPGRGEAARPDPPPRRPPGRGGAPVRASGAGRRQRKTPPGGGVFDRAPDAERAGRPGGPRRRFRPAGLPAPR